MRKCYLCSLPTGDTQRSHCPMCERTVMFISEAHCLGNDWQDLAAADPNPVERERRIQRYQNQAAQRLPLFGR